MNKVNLGNKRICVACSAKFYDLEKNPVACPKCKTMNDLNAQFKVRRKSKVVVQVDSDDPLVKHKAKQDIKQKPKKSSKNIEGVDLEDFDDVVVVEGEDEIEEIEEIDDIEDMEDIEELEDIELEEEIDDDMALDDALIDDVEDGEVEEAEEDNAASAKKPSAKSDMKSRKK